MTNSFRSDEDVISMQDKKISQMKDEMNMLKLQHSAEVSNIKQTLEEREREVLILKQRIQIFFNREFVAVVLGALLIVIFAIFLMYAMATEIQASEVITNGFFVLLGFFFSQTARGFGEGKSTEPVQAPQPVPTQPPPQPQPIYYQLPPQPTQKPIFFVHSHDKAHSHSQDQHLTIIDHEATNNNPDAVLMVTQNWLNDSEIYNPVPVGVWYSPHLEKWTIFNQFAPNHQSRFPQVEMAFGTAFNVQVLLSED